MIWIFRPETVIDAHKAPRDCMPTYAGSAALRTASMGRRLSTAFPNWASPRRRAG